MRFDPRVVGFVAALTLAAPVSGRGQAGPPAPLPSAAEIVERHVAAIGGQSAFKAIRSIHAQGQFSITGLGVTGDFELFALRPNRLLYRVSVPIIGSLETAFDGEIGWTLDPLGGPELLTGRRKQEAADDAWFDHFLYADDYVRSMTPVGRAEFDGRPCLKVRVVLRSGTEQFEYFDAQTGLHAGIEAERETPQGLVPTVSILRNYRRFGSLVQPTTLIQRALGVEQVITISAYAFDTVDPAVFARPPAVVALTTP